MKKLLRPRRNRLRACSAVGAGWLIVLLSATAVVAAIVPTEWQHRQTLDVNAPGLVRVDLPAASFDAAKPQQEDLRVIDAAGREVAFLLDHPPTPVARTIRTGSFATKLESGLTRLTLTTGTTTSLASLTLETPHPFFLRAASVEISDDAVNWTSLDQGLPLFRQWGAEKLELPLDNRSAAYVRVTINDQRGSPVVFTSARINLNAGTAPAAVSVGAHIAHREEFAGETVLTLALDGRHLPLASLELPAGDSLFMRRVTVSVREVNGDISTERIIGSGTIYRVALDGSPTRTQLEIPLAFAPLTRELLVHIHNGDSPPLTLDRVELKRSPLSLLFIAPTAGRYALLSGNPQADAPRYDLAAFASEMREAHAATITPGALEATPDYRPRESLGSATLPEVPLVGAPLDDKAWTRRQSILLTRAGVQELELTPGILAKTRADFGDLRVLRAGNQIPYVLEQPALARALTLTPAASPDAKRPSVSIWQIRLPQAGLPLQRVVLTSATPLFHRQFRLYEKLTNENGGSYELTHAANSWSRTPEPGIPETKLFDISARVRTDTLWIETDNGDNPPIELGLAQAIHPVVRVIFKTGETGGFTLAYDHPSAKAPRYDLTLVAGKLLTAPRNIAQLSADADASSTAGSGLSRIPSSYIFWAALGVVVIVLLVVVARLLPKPPAA